MSEIFKNQKTVLRVSGLGLHYGDAEILNDVHFELKAGEWVMLLGPNGAGKSSLLRCLLGRNQNDKGDVLLNTCLFEKNSGMCSVSSANNGSINSSAADSKCATREPAANACSEEMISITQLSAKTLASCIAYVPQAHTADLPYTVFDTLLMGRVRQLSLFESPRKEDEAAVDDVLQKFGLSSFSNRLFSSLSGGEQQLVLIARAWLQGARILLLDEPTSALDFGNQKRILSEIQKLRDEGMTIFMSTHNPEHALNYSDQVLVLNHGRPEGFGPPSEILTAELLKKIYQVDVKISEVKGRKIIFD